MPLLRSADVSFLQRATASSLIPPPHLQQAPPASLGLLRACDGLLSASGVEGLVALVAATSPCVEGLDLRHNPALGPAGMAQLAQLLRWGWEGTLGGCTTLVRYVT